MNKIYIWQHEIWRKLIQYRNFRSHALLLKGKKGIGKVDFALNFAKALLCNNQNNHQEACGKCSSCSWFEQGGHPNFYQIAPNIQAATSDESTEKNSNTGNNSTIKPNKKSSQQIGVDQIRMLTDFVYMSGHQTGFKIILIHPAESMNVAAANALLKKLEEPPEQVLFILITHQPHHLLPTIRSRCQQIVMPVPNHAIATQWLKQQGINDPAICLAAAGSAPLSALLMNEGEIFLQHEQFIEQISMPHRLDPVLLAETTHQWDLPTIVTWMQKWCYDLLCYNFTGKIRFYLSRQIAIKTLAIQTHPRKLVDYLRYLMTTQRLSHHPLNARLFLEEILISYLHLVSERQRHDHERFGPLQKTL